MSETQFTEQFMMETLKEQRRARRWKIGFRLFFIAYFTGALLIAAGVFKPDPDEVEQHVGVVDVKGMISGDKEASASADRIIAGLKRAFEAKNVSAVILNIDSPGGSPVQSARVYREIMRLKGNDPDRKVIAVGGDLMASGAYYIASAADEIYADPTSIVGSVGVIMSSFGVTELMEKVGVQRRVFTAGSEKAFMDPFLEVSPTGMRTVGQMLGDIHNVFIADVKRGRGDKITLPDEEVFNGLVWTGVRAQSIGLIDGLGSPGEIARDKFGVDKMVDYTVQPSPFERLAGRISTELSMALTSMVESKVQLMAQ